MPKLLETQYETSPAKPEQWFPTELSIRLELTYILAHAATYRLKDHLLKLSPEHSLPIWGENPPKHQAFFQEPQTGYLTAIGSQDIYIPDPTCVKIKIFQNEPVNGGFTGQVTSLSTSNQLRRVGVKDAKHLARYSITELEDMADVIQDSSPIALEDFNQRMQPVLLEIDRQQETLELIMSEAILDH